MYTDVVTANLVSKQQISLGAQHIQGSLNMIADGLKSDPIQGVVPVSPDLQTNYTDLRIPTGGFVCDQTEKQTVPCTSP